MKPVDLFVDILLPLPLKGTFTYRVPQLLQSQVKFGVRAVVSFGRNKFYAGMIVNVHNTPPTQVEVKYITEVLDETAIISEQQLQLWQWMADYYMCTLGEVMACSLPAGLKLAGETQVMIHPDFSGDLSYLTENEILVIEKVAKKSPISLGEISKSVQIQKIIPLVKSLVKKQILIVEEEIHERYKPQKEVVVSLAEKYATQEQALYQLLDDLEQSKTTEKQAQVVLAFLTVLQKKGITKNYTATVPKKELLENKSVSASSFQSLVKKGVFVVHEVVASRLVDIREQTDAEEIVLTAPQETAFQEIKKCFREKNVSLLHGVTGSGKTEIYIKLIQEVLQSGKQVLYLLPEIALTTQIVNRLRKYFGDKVGVYHSRFNEFEKVEIWNRVLDKQEKNGELRKYQLILGARSALLLPFHNLGLIIVDEEHDGSYKQMDPAPRYHARDSAIILSQIHQAKVLLGTATPSLESFYNVSNHRYGYIPLMQRYADSKLPTIWIVNMVETLRQRKGNAIFSQFLIDQIGEALKKKEQVILFQNRRGYALRMFCNACQTMPTCRYCDVTLTYHKKSNQLKCHYCGYAIEVPAYCPTCHSLDVEMKGFGTEKIEDSLAELFPEAVVQRMDLDTTRSKTAYQKIIQDFEQHKTDILVGTQMVTKGLDFDRVSVVGVLNADSLISFPDFRSFERAFQILSQVSGRAGRKEVPGKVIIQSFQPEHPALKYVCNNDFKAMYLSQIAERKQFMYPPVCRLIKLTLKHKDENLLNRAAEVLSGKLREAFHQQVLGPEFPIVSRVQTYYLKDFWIKFPKNKLLVQEKMELEKIILEFRQQIPFKSVQIVINVDA